MTADEKALMQEMAAALTACNAIIRELMEKSGKDPLTMPTTAGVNAWPSVENNLSLITRASVMVSR